MALTLYQNDVSPTSTRVRILGAAKGLEFRKVDVSPMGATLPEHLAMNPLGTLPWLETDGVIVCEPDVICEFLEDVYAEPSLRPADPALRAKARMIARMVDLCLPPAMLKLHLQLDPTTRNMALVDQGHAEIATALRNIAHYIEGPAYAVGLKLSLADCALVPYLFFIEHLVTSAYGRPSIISGKLMIYHDAVRQDCYIARGVEEMISGLAKVRAGA